MQEGQLEYLLQQRHPDKYHSGGLWSNTCCSHPRPGETVKDLAPIADALFVTRGVLRNSIPAETKPNVILRISGGTSIVGPTLENEQLVVDPEEAIRMGASAVGVSIFVGSEYERESLGNLARAVNQYEKYGIPVMAVTAVGRNSRSATLAIWRSAAGSLQSSVPGSSRPTGARSSRRSRHPGTNAGAHRASGRACLAK